jgi:hypothetical protein
MLDFIIFIIVSALLCIFTMIEVMEHPGLSKKKKFSFFLLTIVIPFIGPLIVLRKIEKKKQKTYGKDTESSSSSSITADDALNPHYEGIDIELGD